MGNIATTRATAVLAFFAVSAPMVFAQVPLRSDWRPVASSAVDLGLADLATGAVERVWYAGPTGPLRILTGLGRLYETSDAGTWQGAPAGTTVPPIAAGSARTLPEIGAQVRSASGDGLRVYAFGRFVYRSDDGGRNWENVTGDKRGSIIGDELRDLAVSPGREDELTVAGGAGVFRSLDGGRSWHGLNESLPNLPGARLLSVPTGAVGAQLELAGGLVLEWRPGERRAWRVSQNANSQAVFQLREAFSRQFGVAVTAVTASGTYVYTGDINGRVRVSTDSGRTWTDSTNPQRGRVNSFWVDPDDGRFAVAVLSSRPGNRLLEPQTVLQTINGGGAWDTVSSGLPDTPVNGIAADRAGNFVYLATDAGVYYSRLSLNTFGAPPKWTAIPGLPAGRVSDVRLDAGNTQIWADLEGPGLFRTMAPHRSNDPRVVSAADLVARALAPGGLYSVAGARVESATAGGQQVSVLYATDSESQIQIPYNVSGANIALAISGPQGRRDLGAMALQTTSPAIFEPEGVPLLLDADLGVWLDSMHPARSRMRIQILASGLGRVRPDFPAGTPAPMENSPQVVEPVTVYLDREPVEVLRAVLAPASIGMYLVEIEVPVLINYGMADIYLQVGGRESNHVRVYIEP
ncbi:MAG: hypothetical protein ABI811_19390 [Acidobacteriota bacterium]